MQQQAGVTAVEIQETVASLFHRYDIDGSGTLNSNAELQMLAFNVAYRLNCPVTEDTVQAAISTLGEISDENCFEQTQFCLWFESTLLPSLGVECPKPPV